MGSKMKPYAYTQILKLINSIEEMSTLFFLEEIVIDTNKRYCESELRLIFERIDCKIAILRNRELR